MKRLSAALLCTLALGCVPPGPMPNPTVAANRTEYAPYLAGGNAIITGQAFLKTRGGDVKLGAGSPVYLDPVTGYSSQWWQQRGMNDSYFGIPAPDFLFQKARRSGTVDAQGHFRFAGVAPGWYYVHTKVTWEIGGYHSTQGGVVGDKVLARAGETVEIILTR